MTVSMRCFRVKRACIDSLGTYVRKIMQGLCFTHLDLAAQMLYAMNAIGLCRIKISQHLIVMHLLTLEDEPMHIYLAGVFNDIPQVSDCHTIFNWNSV